MANGQPYPSDEVAPVDGLNIINVSHYALGVDGKGELYPGFQLKPPRRLPRSWWGAGKEPTPPGPDHKLCPVETRMIALAIAMEQARDEAPACV